LQGVQGSEGDMSARKRYEIIIRTDCRACAMAIAGHVPGVAKVRLVQVQDHDIDDDGNVVDHVSIHINSPMIQAHDGSPMLCKDHGKATDLSRDPGES
jgi:hypothetical protein